MTQKKSFTGFFISRPVATTLISAAFLLAGFICCGLLPVAPLPQTDIPTIRVTADFPGASAETMASAVAVPLENAFTGISGLNNMISSSSAGRTTVTMQFDLSQNVDTAAQEVQAAINNTSGKLPQDMPALPKYKKVNPADSPVLVLILKSEHLPLTELSDLAENIIAKQINKIAGVAELNLIGQQRPAINIKVNPKRLAAHGLTLAEIRTALQKNSVNQAKGLIYGKDNTAILQVNDQLFKPEEYAEIIVAVKNGAPVYLKDIAEIKTGTENKYVRSWPEGKAGISIEINRQTGANIVKIADSVRAMLPELQSMLPQTAELSVLNDRTRTIRSSLHEIQLTFVITLFLVLGVMSLFLKNTISTVIVSLTLISALVSSLSFMYILGFSLNNLTLLALVIAIGFVVDDAIVVIENIYRHLENGESPYEAAQTSCREIFFTLLAISSALIAAFIPLFFMGGTVGKLFWEFAATVTVTVLFSAFFSLTLAPMLAAKFMKPQIKSGNYSYLTEKYSAWLKICFRHRLITMTIFGICLLTAAAGLIFIPKGFFPLQDIAYISGSTQADEDVSFAQMTKMHKKLAEIIAKEPAVMVYTHAVGDKNFNSLSSGKFWLVLKDRKDRELGANELINKLRPELNSVSGIKMSLRAAQDMNFSLTQTSAQYLYTLRAQNADELYDAAEKLTAAMEKSSLLKDVQSDLRLGSRMQNIVIDREKAALFGVTAEDVDQLLYDAFGQRQVAEYQTDVNQYKVILELDDKSAARKDSLNYLYLKSAVNGRMIPLVSMIKKQNITAGPTVINRDNQFPAVNISFNLADGISLGQALNEITLLRKKLNIPDTVFGTPQEAAKEFAEALKNEFWLILLAVAAIYIILGILYESFSLPLVIISTLPAGICGAVLFLFLLHTDFSVIALIGCLMLVGIVMKNGILMVDTALKLENEQKLSAEKAIFQAAVTRFRPIIMTSLAAMLSGIPLIIGQGTGAEMWQPLGIVIAGGLLVSQLLTVFTTPVIYLYAAKLRHTGTN